MDMGLRACEDGIGIGMENEFGFEFEGGARKGDGWGWPIDRWEAKREGGGCVLGVMLVAIGVVEACDML